MRAIRLIMLGGGLAVAACSANQTVKPEIAVEESTSARAPMGRAELSDGVAAELMQAEQVIAVAPPPGVDASLLLPSETNHTDGRSLAEVVAAFHAQPLPADVRPSTSSNRFDVTVDVNETAALQHYVRGRMASESGRHLEAIEHFRDAMQLDPGSTDIRRSLARSHLAANQRDPAMKAYRALVVAVPDDAEGLFILAADRMSTAPGEAVILLAHARVAHDASPEPDPALGSLIDLQLAQLMFREGEDAAGLEAALRGVELNPQVIPATHMARAAVSAFRQLPILRVQIGDVFCRDQNYVEAIALYEDAFPPGNDPPRELMSRLMYAYLAVGRPYSAQLRLLEMFEQANGQLDDRDVALAAYVADHAPSTRAFAGAMQSTFGNTPDDEGVLRAMAVLLPVEESIEMRSAYAMRYLDRVSTWGRLLRGQPCV
ncbi:MAG: tetratricopeptide repeat protein [Planctomycetota bacterium]